MRIKRNELVKALEGVKDGLANKEFVEQTTCFIFDGEGTVFSFNDEIAVSHKVPKGIKGAVQAKELLALLLKMGELEIEVDTTDTEIIIKGDRRKAGIALEQEIKITLDDVGTPKTWEDIYTKKQYEGSLADALKDCIPCTSSNMMKPQLTGVHIDGRYMVASDNMRLIRYDLKRIRCALPDGITIPATAAKGLIKHNPIQYGQTKGWMHFRNKLGVVFSCRLIQEEFPQTKGFFNITGTTVPMPEGLDQVLKLAGIFIADSLDTPQVFIQIKKGRCIVSSQGEKGWYEETIRIKHKGEEFSFSANPTLLEYIIKETSEATVREDKRMMKFEGENFVYCCTATPPDTRGEGEE